MDYFGSFGPSRVDALRLLEPILDEVLEAHQSGVYADFSKHATEEFLTKVTQQGFENAHRAIQPGLGELLSKSFLGSLNKGTNPMLMYSTKYTGTSDDVLIRVVFKNQSSPPKIEWLWIE